MYNQTYEEYMRNVLGYVPSYHDMEYTYRNANDMYYAMPENQMSSMDIDSMYPDIYHEVYPMVKKVCTNHQGKITKEAIEKITMEIFANIEGKIEIGAKVMAQRNPDHRSGTRQEENRNRNEDRNRNDWLRDLIRILVLRELLGGNRPPMGGPRPPFPRPNPRPPFPRGLETTEFYGENLY